MPSISMIITGTLTQLRSLIVLFYLKILNRSKKLNVFAEEIYDLLKEEVMIVYLSENDFMAALDLNKHFGNSINYSDCTIVKTMGDLGINRIISFDDDFDKIRGIERIH